MYLSNNIKSNYQAVKWTKSKALAGLDSYAATGYAVSLRSIINIAFCRFDAFDTLSNIVEELKTDDKTKTELKENVMYFSSTLNLK